MPFQVVLSSSLAPPGEIIFFTAGEDQTALCTPNLTLTAEVTGILSGHTLLWEQIAGDELNVIWDTPLNQLVVSYHVINDSYVDRTFRFWLDKGSSFQQFDDITIFGTPTEKTYLASAIPLIHTPLNSNYGTGNREVTLTLSRGTFFLDGLDFSSSECGFTPDSYFLRWKVADPTDLVRFLIQEKNGTWVTVATVPIDPDNLLATKYWYKTPAMDKLYRVVAEYQHAPTIPRGFTISELATSASNTIWTIPTTIPGYFPRLPVGAVSVDSTCMGGAPFGSNTINIPVYDVIQRTIKVLCAGDRVDQTYLAGEPTVQNVIKVPVYTVLQRSLLALCAGDRVDQTYLAGEPTKSTTLKIPLFDVLDRQGGDIGGP